ncbi:MAG: helix-turn-helix domain-containing protein [Novosphingobium sp.]|nr:helix-turn-helix domain-containing protein [Novosphingobium sp.]
MTLDLLDSEGHVRRLSDIRAEVIDRVLVANRWNISATAAALGMGRSTIYRRYQALKRQLPDEE